MTVITITQHAGEFERYSENAFAAQIGHEIPFRIDTTARVLAVEVSPDLRSVDITLDVDDERWADAYRH